MPCEDKHPVTLKEEDISFWWHHNGTLVLIDRDVVVGISGFNFMLSLKDVKFWYGLTSFYGGDYGIVVYRHTKKWRKNFVTIFKHIACTEYLGICHCYSL